MHIFAESFCELLTAKWPGLLWISVLKLSTYALCKNKQRVLVRQPGDGNKSCKVGEMRGWLLKLALLPNTYTAKWPYNVCLSLMKSGFLFQVEKKLIWRCLLLPKFKWYENKESLGKKNARFCSLLYLNCIHADVKAIFKKKVSINEHPLTKKVSVKSC